MEKVAIKENRGSLLSVIRGTLYAVSFSLVAILVLALAFKYLSIPENFIMPINQVIKVLSIFFGVFVALKKHKSKGLLTGLLIGFFYTIIAFALFSTLSNNFTFNMTIFNDIVFGTLIGAICGIISVNLRKN